MGYSIFDPYLGLNRLQMQIGFLLKTQQKISQEIEVSEIMFDRNMD